MIDIDKTLALYGYVAVKKDELEALKARAEAAEAENARLREALERFAKIDLNDPIAGSIGWDILNARAALQPPTEETE